jgi:hypothetical protein
MSSVLLTITLNVFAESRRIQMFSKVSNESVVNHVTDLQKNLTEARLLLVQCFITLQGVGNQDLTDQIDKFLTELEGK